MRARPSTGGDRDRHVEDLLEIRRRALDHGSVAGRQRRRRRVGVEADVLVAELGEGVLVAHVGSDPVSRMLRGDLLGERRALARHTAVRPFEARVAAREVRLAEDDDAALETALAGHGL